MARQAVGTTPETRARWLLKFSQLDWKCLRAEDQYLLRVELAVFMGSDLRLRRPDGTIVQSQLPTEIETKQWQRDVKQGLALLKTGQPWSPAQVGLRTVLRLNDGKLLLEETRGPLHQADRFIVKAVEALVKVGDRVRLCAREDCRKPFIRNMRQDYCSQTCRGTVNKREYRQQNP